MNLSDNMRLEYHQRARCAAASFLVVLFMCLLGCVAQQADLKQTESKLQKRIKKQDEQLSQTRARQSQEISALRDRELPQLRGELERALHTAKNLQAKQEDLKHRSAQLEQQTKKLEELAAKMDADNTTRTRLGTEKVWIIRISRLPRGLMNFRGQWKLPRRH